MAAESTLEPTIPREEEPEENDDEGDEGEESDVYETDGDENPYDYDEEDDDGDGDEEVGEGEPENMTALLLGKQNGATRTEEDDEDEDEEYEEYEDGQGTAENPTDISSAVAGSKRGADELCERDAHGEELDDNEAEEKAATKKVRV